MQTAPLHYLEGRNYTVSPARAAPPGPFYSARRPRVRLQGPNEGELTTKPRVLYVLGYGRSGSTMLGMALGQHPDVVNLGEISALRRFVPGPTYVPPRACGCLLQLDQCPFWTGVARRLGSMERLARTDLALSPTLGWRRYVPWLPEPSDELPLWGKAAAALYQATLEQANARVAVDTSKGIPRAWWLWRSGAVDLRFALLTRRPEDVLRSQIKHGHSILSTAVSWNLAQRQVVQLTRHVEGTGSRVLRISYERLTEQPQRVLSEILEHAGLPWHDAVLTPHPDHLIGGDHAVKLRGRHAIEPSTGVRPPLPLKARLTLKLLNDRLTGPAGN